MKQINRNKPNKLSHPTGHVMRINGETVHITTARYDYRCAECLGTLEYLGAGVGCVSDHNHRGYIHKKDAAIQAAAIEETVSQVSQVYEIIDGKLVVKEK